jgi:hypothetical protein
MSKHCLRARATAARVWATDSISAALSAFDSPAQARAAADRVRSSTVRRTSSSTSLPDASYPPIGPLIRHAAVNNLVPAVHAGNVGTGRPVAGQEDGEAARVGQTVAARERDADERQALADERERRQQAEIDRASAKTARGLSALPPDSGSVIERSRKLYQQALTVIEACAASQEQVAGINEDLAASRTSHREEYRRVAEQARATAHRAREILRTLKTD